jgi:hypothetical protein
MQIALRNSLCIAKGSFFFWGYSDCCTYHSVSMMIRTLEDGLYSVTLKVADMRLFWYMHMLTTLIQKFVKKPILSLVTIRLCAMRSIQYQTF